MTRKRAPAHAGAFFLCAPLLAGLLAGLPGCGGLPWTDDRARTAEAARDAGFRGAVINAGAFDLRIWLHLAGGKRAAGPRDVLAVYIEGDGAPWIGGRPPQDPTPRRAAGFDMALANAALGADVLYVARPCQFVQGRRRRGCAVPVWAEARFSKAVVDAADAAVSAVARRYGFKTLDLIGYSGGGAVAVLMAARRAGGGAGGAKDKGAEGPNIRRVVTAAGVLDHEVWTRHHRVSPLSRSLNPAGAAEALAAAGVPQTHFTGGNDDVAPPGLFKALLARIRARGGQGGPAAEQTIPGIDHACCWAQKWPRIARRLQLGLRGP